MAQVRDSLTFTGAAQLAGKTEGAIRAAIRRGELRPEESADGRVKLLPRKQVEAWASQVRKPGPKAAPTPA